ncbi:MAG: hypothetical protein IH994_09005 [Proteobacteria bacterium]|nr:hypothetical protein [Pseudomonadota bacterium]
MRRVFSSVVIIAAASVFGALFVLNLTNWVYFADTLAAIAYHYALPAALVAAALFIFRLSANGRLTAALCFAAVVPALYLTELALGEQARNPDARMGGDIDRRSKLDVILDLRQQGIDAYPAMRARSMLVPGPGEQEPGEKLVSALGGDGLLPLASLPGKRTVTCNESGAWVTFDSDEYGFNNPPGSWKAPPRIALVGDSFTQGDCVPPEKNIAAHLNRRFGGVLNLGVAGHGPLSELAAVKEYLSPIKPKVVLWMYFEGNDLFKDLPEERRSEVLMSYLEEGFRQGLMEKGEEAARRFQTYLDNRLTEAMGRVDSPYEGLLDFLKLFYLRENFGLDPVGLGLAEPVTKDDLDLFRDILREARRTVGSWGGKLVFVFMPDAPRYFASARNSRIRDRVRRQVLDIAKDLGLPVIDVHEVFAAAPDPQALFVYPGSHYNEDGYKRAADAIAQELKKGLE